MAITPDELGPGGCVAVSVAEVDGVVETVDADVTEERPSVDDAVGVAELASIVMLKYAEVCWALELLSCSQKRKIGESES